jgi:hypothetical protein
VTAAVGAWNAPLDADEDSEDDAVVVVTAGTVEAVEPEAGAADAGGSTANWEPVTTVTSAPSVVGPRAVTTAPDRERATA